MEKSCSREEGHPSSHANFGSVYVRKKLTPFARASSSWVMYAVVVSALTELTRLSEPKCLHGEVGPAGRMTLPLIKGEPAETTIVSRVNGSPSFIRKGRESWLAQGSLAGWGEDSSIRDKISPYK